MSNAAGQSQVVRS